MKNTSSILSVSVLTKQIKENLELNFRNLWVQGEASNVRYATSGHLYFTLKDEFAQISCVMWRSQVQSNIFKVDDGLKLIVHGNVSLYEVRGSYQINCTSIKPVGIGELQLAFEQLKNKLQSEGFFDLELKKQIPLFPKSIGIITSPQGAVFHDLLTNIKRRFPIVEINFIPVKVQGKDSVKEIVDAINYFDVDKSVDFIILARGGGSLEDLWSFNSEEIARAIFNCNIPIVSAIGHETDFTISDFVADFRAPTPSSAAELVVPNQEEVIESFTNSLYIIESEVENGISEKTNWINSTLERYWYRFPQELINQYKQTVDYFLSDLDNSKINIFKNTNTKLNNFKSNLEMLNPKAVLKRGYSITTKNGKVILSSKEIKYLDKIETILADGKINSTANKN